VAAGAMYVSVVVVVAAVTGATCVNVVVVVVATAGHIHWH
jgi:hypothetical protein